jgi:DNA invertase Pin-like site-specific DNA recombinase
VIPQRSASARTRVAIYARVSTLKEQDPEMQLRELREYAMRRGWEAVDEYTDRASGSKDSRPELNRMVADAHLCRFDAVLVWKIDRFGRSLKHLVNAIADLSAYNVAFVSLRDNIDLSTPAGRLMFQIIGAMAEFERSLIQERVRAEKFKHVFDYGSTLNGHIKADISKARPPPTEELQINRASRFAIRHSREEKGP